MPIVLIVIAITVALLVGIILLIVGMQDKNHVPLCFGVPTITIGVLLLVWTILSLDQGFVLDGIYKVETVKTINGSAQFVMDSRSYLHNITKKLGATFPDGSMVKIEYYEDTTNGIDWLNSNYPFYTIISPAQGE